MSKRVIYSLLAVSLALPFGYSSYAGDPESSESKEHRQEAGEADKARSNADKQLEHILKRFNESDGYTAEDEVLWEPTYKMAMREQERKQYAGEMGGQVGEEDSGEYPISPG